MDIYTFCRVQYVEKEKRKALSANTCHLDVPSNVADDVIARGHARAATVGEIAEAEATAGRTKPAKDKPAKAAKDDAADKAATDKAATDKAATDRADLA